MSFRHWICSAAFDGKTSPKRFVASRFLFSVSFLLSSLSTSRLCNHAFAHQSSFFNYYSQSTFLLLIPSFQRFAVQALPISNGLDLLKPPPVIARLQNIITLHGSRVSLLQFKPAKFILIIIRLTLMKKIIAY